MTIAIGVDLGGTKTAVGVVDHTGAVLTRFESPTPSRAGSAAIVENVVELSRRAAREFSDIRCLGIGAAGVVDSATGTIIGSTDTLPGWQGTSLAELLSQRLALPVAALNDVHAHGVGEAWVGAAAGASSALLVAAGTGIGGALIVNGAVIRGAHSVAGHIGHVPSAMAAGLSCTCGKTGHLEVVASGPAIHAAYLRSGGAGGSLTARDVFARAEGGDERAARVVHTAATALGRAVGGFINAFDPEVVVIAGGLAASGDRWWHALREAVAGETMASVADTRLCEAVLGGDAAIVGAAREAFRSVALAGAEDRTRDGQPCGVVTL